jgi:hypothetical protein
MWQKTITVRNNNVAYCNNQMSIKKKLRSYGSATSKFAIFHDLLISHLIIITFIVYKLNGKKN